MKMTFQPKKGKGKGSYQSSYDTKAGRRVLKSRRAKGRKVQRIDPVGGLFCREDNDGKAQCKQTFNECIPEENRG